MTIVTIIQEITVGITVRLTVGAIAHTEAETEVHIEIIEEVIATIIIITEIDSIIIKTETIKVKVGICLMAAMRV